MPDPAKFEEKSIKKVRSFSDHSWDGLFMNFGAILAPSWEPKWKQHRHKKGVGKIMKNDDDQDGGEKNRFWRLRVRSAPGFWSLGRSPPLLYRAYPHPSKTK